MMISCKEAARLVSEMKDRDVAWSERVSLRFHLLMCRMCRMYQRNLEMLSNISRHAGNLSLSRDTTTEYMPVAARQRIKDKLTENK